LNCEEHWKEELRADQEHLKKEMRDSQELPERRHAGQDGKPTKKGLTPSYIPIMKQ
jgi:hypothetical protein